MKTIELTKGQVALVDDADFETLNQYNWCARYDKKMGQYYAYRNSMKSDGLAKRKTISMHRQILGITDPKIDCDHLNHDTLDNRRTNIRAVSHRTNTCNLKKKPQCTSMYSGVYWNKKNEMWVARIEINNKLKYLGQFEDEETAAIHYIVAYCNQERLQQT